MTSQSLPLGRRKTWVTVSLGFAGLAVFGLVAAMLLTQPAQETHKRIPQITVLRLPPPPPPKPEEKPPEPPKVKQEVQVEQPKPVDEPQPAPTPPQGPLGLDAQGSGPGDGFGLAGRPGGRDITIGGHGGSEFTRTMYGNGAARFIAQELGRDPKLKAEVYRIEVRVWIGADGRFSREEIVRGTGDERVDALIRQGLARLSPYRQQMPENTPQPLLIRVTSADSEG